MYFKYTNFYPNNNYNTSNYISNLLIIDNNIHVQENKTKTFNLKLSNLKYLYFIENYKMQRLKKKKEILLLNNLIRYRLLLKKRKLKKDRKLRQLQLENNKQLQQEQFNKINNAKPIVEHLSQVANKMYPFCPRYKLIA